jgi:hypothetical protein
MTCKASFWRLLTRPSTPKNKGQPRKERHKKENRASHGGDVFFVPEVILGTIEFEVLYNLPFLQKTDPVSLQGGPDQKNREKEPDTGHYRRFSSISMALSIWKQREPLKSTRSPGESRFLKISSRS